LHQKTLLEMANTLPQSEAALQKIKGMGRKKSQKFGDELLEIITAYCNMENIASPEASFAENKIPKKKKEDSKKISLDLFYQGKSLSQIAEERELSMSTIEGHLAYYVGTGEIPVTEFVSQEMANLITSHFDGADDLRMGPVKEALGDKVSWSEIRFVVNHLMFLRKSEMDQKVRE